MTSRNISTAPASLDALIRALEASDALVACEPLLIDGDLPLVRIALSADGFDVALDVECAALGEDEPVAIGQPVLHPASRVALETAELLPRGDRDLAAAIAARGRLELTVALAHRDAIAAAAPRLAAA